MADSQSTDAPLCDKNARMKAWREKNREHLKASMAEWRAKNGPRCRLYGVWSAIIRRCYDPNTAWFHLYGGRGIEVCERWRSSFAAFAEDMGVPGSGMQIDRIDNSKGYFPENCRWVGVKEQSRNRRNNAILEHNGESKTIAEWAEVTGIPASTISLRIRRLGYPVERALTQLTPRMKRAANDTNRANANDS